tara:strand:+ start:259 stop:645 length:387 start_codon:yes stop_codon:yes gene_type:complete
MEDKSMNFKKIILTLISFIMSISILLASDQNSKLFDTKNIKDPNIKKEMKILSNKYELEKKQVRKSYDEKINELKELRKSEIKSLRKIYSKKRDTILKYDGDKKSNSKVILKTSKKKDRLLKKEYTKD